MGAWYRTVLMGGGPLTWETDRDLTSTSAGFKAEVRADYEEEDAAHVGGDGFTYPLPRGAQRGYRKGHGEGDPHQGRRRDV